MAGPVRIDGLPKVLGAKLYARDLRASDMAGWPTSTLHAWLLRAEVGDRPVKLDLQAVQKLPIQPVAVVTAADIVANHIKPTNGLSSFAKCWLVPDGELPDHAWQPVAILIFERFSEMNDVRQWVLLDGNSLLRYGPVATPSPEQDVRRLLDPLLAVRQKDAQGMGDAVHFIRIAGENDDVFSFVKNGRHDPTAFGPAVTVEQRPKNLLAMQSRDAVEGTIAQSDWTTLDRTFSTQTTDPMFMEPEAGLAWHDVDAKQLHLVVGTQSPADDRDEIQALLADNACPFRESRVRLKSCYPGGGFGGRDKSSFPYYLALAALFSGRPVRLAFDRFEQFVAGIKRHASAVQCKLSFDSSGTVQALQAALLLDGGGELNLSNAVVSLTALHAAGPYRIPRTVVSARGFHSRGAPAGSMRGFGIPQATFAIESVMDEAAERLKVDPIEFRLKHSLRRGERDITGMTLDHHLGNSQICELALAEPLWKYRATEKLNRDREGLLAYGVGFAGCMEAYGTSSDAIYTAVELRSDGSIFVRSSGVDMGQGSATSVCIATAPILGRSAADIAMGETEFFDVLKMKRGEPTSDAANPRLTPKLVNSASASVTAFHLLHATEEACRVIFDHGLVPAAQQLWGGAPIAGIHWDQQNLVADGFPALSIETLAHHIHTNRLVNGAIVHTFYQHDFAQATFLVDGASVKRAVDGLAVVRGSNAELLDRTNPEFPGASVKTFRRTLYASAGHLVAVQVHLPTGRVRILDAITFLDAGDVHHPALLEGQVEGGLAMGLGYALLEELPSNPAGTDGSWNLHRYQVARAKHIPLDHLSLRLVPLDGENIVTGRPGQRKKGIAEATMTTVPPAVANAIAHAIGVRINSLPITPSKILEALASP